MLVLRLQIVRLAMARSRSSLQGNLFRTPQSFQVSTARQLLEKLYWDLDLLEQLRWDENLGKTWRRAVAYKAMDCAMTIWHMAEWFAGDIRAKYPTQGACDFLGIVGHDPFLPIQLKTLREAAVKKCPDLEICRIIAVASKHYEVNTKPRPDLRTSCIMRLAKRGSETFMRPVMWLEINDAGSRRELREVFHVCYVFWSNLAYVSRPGPARAAGEPLPPVKLPAYRPTPDRFLASRSRRPWSRLFGLLTRLKVH